MTKEKLATWNGVPVYLDFLPYGTRRTGQQLDSVEPRFCVFHDTGNPNSTAQNNVDYYKRTFNIGWDSVASAHFFVDDKECIICIPVNEKAWHVIYDTPTDNWWYGDDANDVAFGGEACYFNDRKRSLKSLDNMCRIMAALCESWDIDHKTEMPGHQDIQFDKQDPGNLLEACGYDREDMWRIDDLVSKYREDGDCPEPKIEPAPETIIEGQPEKVYKVQPGDSLWAIYRKTKTPIARIRELNGLDEKSVIHPGDVLTLA